MELIKVIINDQELSLDKEVLTQGIEKKEIIVKDENLIMFKKPDYEIRLKNEKDTEYKKGRTDGVEILIKEQKHKLGLEFDGKEPDMLLTKFKEKIESDLQIEPDKKVKELTTTIEQLQVNLKKEIEKNTSMQNSFTAKENENKLNSTLFATIPEKAVSKNLTRKEVVALFNANGYTYEIADGKEVVKLNGEVVKNTTTLEPLSLSDVMNKFVVEKKLIEDDGRGGKDEPNIAKPGTIESFNKEMLERNPPVKYGTTEYFNEMQKRIKDKTLKV
jgi:hypothetical protein